jgi:hypothetical protein
VPRETCMGGRLLYVRRVAPQHPNNDEPKVLSTSIFDVVRHGLTDRKKFFEVAFLLHVTGAIGASLQPPPVLLLAYSAAANSRISSRQAGAAPPTGTLRPCLFLAASPRGA